MEVGSMRSSGMLYGQRHVTVYGFSGGTRNNMMIVV